MSYLQVSISTDTTYTFALPPAKPHELVILSSHQFVTKADESLAQLIKRKNKKVSIVKVSGLSERLMERMKETMHRPVWMLVEHLDKSEDWQITLQEMKKVSLIV